MLALERCWGQRGRPVAVRDAVGRARRAGPWAIARLRAPGNQALCPWCGRALDEFKGVARQLRELAGEEATVPAGLVSNVMRAVGEHAAAARAALTPPSGTLRVVRPMLLSEGRGATWVADRLVARTGRRIAEATPGVRAVVGRGGVAVAVGEQGVIVALRLMIDCDRVVPEVAGAVRAAVLDAVEGQIGLPVFAINVLVDGVTATSHRRASVTFRTRRRSVAKSAQIVGPYSGAGSSKE